MVDRSRSRAPAATLSPIARGDISRDRPYLIGAAERRDATAGPARAAAMPSQTSPTDRGGPSGGYKVATRQLKLEGAPALEIVETQPEGPRIGAPLLLLHGAFGGAWTWAEHLGPYLARRGRASLAVSLRGHGGSEGRERVRDTTLDDYLADVAAALALFRQTPVVVGHSLGGLLAQRLVGRAQMRGLALICSLPPEGRAPIDSGAAPTEPVVWRDTFAPATPQTSNQTGGAHRQVFSPSLPEARARRFCALMTPEAPRALAEAQTPGAVLSAFLTRIPSLVIGAAQDPLVRRSCTLRTAFYHAARHETLDPSGHFPMLDVSAETLGRTLVDWLVREGL